LVLGEEVLALALGEVTEDHGGVLRVPGNLRKWSGNHNVRVALASDKGATPRETPRY
jgi:hypothetical protein